MGICAHKKDQEDVNPPSLPLPAPPSARRNVFQHLIELKKIRQVPVLSLATNPLFVKRTEASKALDNSNEPTSQMHTTELKEDSVL